MESGEQYWLRQYQIEKQQHWELDESLCSECGEPLNNAESWNDSGLCPRDYLDTLEERDDR